jgi:hypothetical protein
MGYKTVRKYEQPFIASILYITASYSILTIDQARTKSDNLRKYPVCVQSALLEVLYKPQWALGLNMVTPRTDRQ